MQAKGIGELPVFGEIPGYCKGLEAASKADFRKMSCRGEKGGGEKQRRY
jgi:hypothetical protein